MYHTTFYGVSMTYKNAFVSVYDKKGLYEFLKPMKGLRIVSTGGTAKYLKSKGLSVTELSRETRFPEVFSGRVKSLHPFLYMPLLARKWVKKDQQTLKQHKLIPFDLVVCTLYPFAMKRHLTNDKELTEWIDVGGPSLLRAAAKNFFSVTVICSPDDYNMVQKGTSVTQRKFLSAKVFEHLSQYDALIAKTLLTNQEKELRSLAKNKVQTAETPKIPHSLKNRIFKALRDGKIPNNDLTAIPEKQLKLLRYGENPHQRALWWNYSPKGLHKAQILQGKALSFNNLLDLQTAVSCLRDFPNPTVIAVKHNNPCGIASGIDIHQALQKAISADPLSIFGGVLGANRKITETEIKQLKPLFIECLIAPDFSPETLNLLREKKNLRLLKWPDMLSFPEKKERDFKPVDGGILLQEKDSSLISNKEADFSKVIGKKPGEKIKEDLLFAWKTAAHLKSNSIAIVKNQQTLGLGMGQVSRVDSVKLALQRLKKFHPKKNRSLILASDGFFPFKDSIELIAQKGIHWIIQPGGSLRDKEVIERAKQLKINMILTGIRHFKH